MLFRSVDHGQVTQRPRLVEIDSFHRTRSPGDGGVRGRPAALGLYRSVLVTLLLSRQNLSQALVADWFGYRKRPCRGPTAPAAVDRTGHPRAPSTPCPRRCAAGWSWWTAPWCRSAIGRRSPPPGSPNSSPTSRPSATSATKAPPRSDPAANHPAAPKSQPTTRGTAASSPPPGRRRTRHRALEGLEILAYGYRGRLTELPNIIRIVATLGVLPTQLVTHF